VFPCYFSRSGTSIILIFGFMTKFVVGKKAYREAEKRRDEKVRDLASTCVVVSDLTEDTPHSCPQVIRNRRNVFLTMPGPYIDTFTAMSPLPASFRTLSLQFQSHPYQHSDWKYPSLNTQKSISESRYSIVFRKLYFPVVLREFRSKW
jgi:hypothetical protein